MSAKVAVCTVFLGCCLNLIFLELIIKEDPGCGSLVTFLQFAFIALEGFVTVSKFGTVKAGVPLKEYFIVMSLFFLCNVCNNYAFDFNIPMPLHMIFRAGSLITNMIMCVVVLKRSYSLTKYLSVLLITLGIIICTIVSGKEVKSIKSASLEQAPSNPVEDFFWWSVGIALLTFGLLVSARMGIYQEEIHTKFGKRPREALYYTHLLSLPFFVLLTSNIWEHLKIAFSSTPLIIPTLGYAVPSTLIYLLGNILTQYVCIRSVYHLVSESTSLTVNLVLTLRKFTSLIISVIYFENAFTSYHWTGTILVFIGTVMFTEVIPTIRNSLAQRRQKKVQ